jgi:hypothetical protein
MFSRDYYEAEFAAYTDLVTLKEMRKMLGGISEKKALDLLHSKLIKAFYIEQRYLIPKVCIIDYLISRIETAKDSPRQNKKSARRRKPGTGCIRQLNDNLWEGKYAPINAHGQRIARHVYAKTQAECESKLMKLIGAMGREIATEKEAQQIM